MDKFDELVQAQKRKHEPNIEGCFDCQQCGETVEGAYLDGVQGVMLWNCSQGHTSFIKDVGL